MDSMRQERHSVKAAPAKFNLLASMRARYWEVASVKNATGTRPGPFHQDRIQSSSLLQGLSPSPSASERPKGRSTWRSSQHSARSNAARNVSQPMHSPRHRQLAASNTDTPLAYMGEIYPEMPARLGDEQRHFTEQAGQGAAARDAPVHSGRAELIASIVDTGIQIATRMGDRAAAAEFCMSSPSREAVRPAGIDTLPGSGMQAQ